MARVLVVDDAATSRAWATSVLEGEGHAVVCVEDPGAARPHVAEADVVVLDWLLAGGSGLDLCREITARDPHPPVLMLTALEDRRDGTLARHAGAAAFVRKTGGAEELLDAVRDVLAGA